MMMTHVSQRDAQAILRSNLKLKMAITDDECPFVIFYK